MRRSAAFVPIPGIVLHSIVMTYYGILADLTVGAVVASGGVDEDEPNGCDQGHEGDIWDSVWLYRRGLHLYEIRYAVNCTTKIDPV